MKIFLIASFIGIAFAQLPISDHGCQCLSECEICSSYHSFTGCPVNWQAFKICKVNTESCTDYNYDKEGYEGDECGSLADIVTDLFDKMKAWFHGAGKDIKELHTKIQDWADEYIHAIDIDDLVATEPDMLAKIASAWKKFDENQLSKLKEASSEAWDGIIAQIPPEDLAALDAAIQSKLDVAEKIAQRIKSLTLEDVAQWVDKQWDRIPIDNLANMGWSLLQKVPLEELGAWTKEQWAKIPVDKLVRFTGEQIAKIDADSIGSLANEFWSKVPVYQVVHFGVELIQSAEVLQNLNATQIAYFTASQWQSVPIDSIVEFTVEKVQAIDYEALGTWTKETWDKMPIDKVTAFIDRQIQSVPAETVGEWTKEQWDKFPMEGAIMFTGEQLAAGANALKDLTEEQLAKYDWEQIADDALAELPVELQEKIATLREHATDFDAKEFKELKFRAADAKKATITKLKGLQLINDNPEATTEQKQQAQIEYNAAVTVESKLVQESQQAQQSMEMYALPKAEIADGAGAATFGAVLLTALFL